MRLNHIDLNLFVVFEAIYQQRNLTRAAEVLCMTQPAVSNALSRLRNALDDPLFVRSAQGMSPTPLAENIAGRVQEALNLLNTSVTEGDVFRPDQASKVFRLSMNDMAEAMILPGLLAHLQVVAPNVGVACYDVPREAVERELAAGTLDFALDAPVVTGDTVCTRPLLRQPYVCVVRGDHPGVGDSLGLEEYLALEHVSVSSRRTGPGYVDRSLIRLGHQRHIKVSVQHYQVAPLLVAQTNMALTIPVSLAGSHPLKVLALPFCLPPVDLHLYWHASVSNDKASQWFRQCLIEACQQHQAPAAGAPTG